MQKSCPSQAQSAGAGPLEKALEANAILPAEIFASLRFTTRASSFVLIPWKYVFFIFASSRIVSVSTGLEASASRCFQLESLQSSVMGVCFAPMLCVLFLSALDLSTHRHANSGMLSLLSCVGLENWKHLASEKRPLDLPRLLQSPHKLPPRSALLFPQGWVLSKRQKMCSGNKDHCDQQCMPTRYVVTIF